jgi:hypothetical protein
VGSPPADESVASPVDGVVVVFAPPDACTTPDRGSAVDAESDDEDDVPPDSPVEPSDDDGPDAVDVESGDDALSEVDSEPDDVDDPASDGSAAATHGEVATPAPIPSATASAPTRPTYFAFPMPVLLPAN